MPVTSRNLSVNIICQNEEETLPYTLHCIEQVLLPVLAEVVIVDGGSKDDTRMVIGESKLPIIFIEHPFDSCGAQKNRGLELCTGEYILDIDADITFTNNLGSLYQLGYFRQHDAWDFGLAFTVKDEYCTFSFTTRWGPTLKIFRNGMFYDPVHHQHMNCHPRVCPEVKMFENSHLQTQRNLVNRGQRWQRLAEEIAREGPPMGKADRYVESELWGRYHNEPFPEEIKRMIIPRDTGRLKMIDLIRGYEPSRGKGETPQWVLQQLA
jgi:glycosyltransferase involved in cell wall biosynthesis